MPVQIRQVGLVLGPLDGATAFVAAHSSRYLVDPAQVSGVALSGDAQRPHDAPLGVYERRDDGRFWWVGWE
jgi:hypothetical protein